MMKAGWRVWAGIAAGVAVATACASPAANSSAAAEQQVNAAPPSVLLAVVALEGGCTAAKVGPKHLLVAARCVTNKPGIAIGKTLRFRKGGVTIDTGDVRTTAVTDDAATNASSDDASAAPPTTDAAAPDSTEAMIAQVQIHPSYLQACGNGACDPGKPGSVDVADVAIIVLTDEIADLPIAPIELDPASAGTRVLVVGYGCGPASTAEAPRLRAKETEIAKPEAAAYPGSPYSAEAASALAASYVTTRGPGDGEARNALGICSDKDLGAPLFLADGSAIVGVNSNTTPSSTPLLPMTNQHARVDTAARHGVGAWLTQMGVRTSRACAATDAGCKPLETPPSDDAGASSDAAASPDSSLAQPLTPNGEGSASDDGASAATTSATPRATPAPSAADGGGCSATPRPGAPGAGFGVLALAAIGASVTVRRRRRR